MTENKKLIVKNSYDLAQFKPNKRKELVIRGLNTLTGVRDANFYFFKGEEHRIKGEFSEAISYYKRALQIDLQHADAFFYLEWLYNKKGDYEKAVEAYQEVIHINPDYPYIHYNIGWAYGELG